MIVFVIEIEDLAFLAINREGDSPIAGDGQAPRPFAITRELVPLPPWDVVEFPDVVHLLQESHHIADPLDSLPGQPGRVVALDEAAKAAVDHIPDLQ